MKEIKAVGAGYSSKEDDADEYYSVVGEDGRLTCSCGRELVKMDEETYMCPGGYPVYKFKNGEVVIDKFGNMMFKKKPHREEDEDGD